MVRNILIFIFLAVNLYAQEFKVEAFTDTTDYLIGDQIKVHYIVEHNKGISFAEPAFRDSITNIDFVGLNKLPAKEENGKIVTAYEVVLSRFDSSDIRIPPIKFYYWYGKPEDKAAFLMDEYHQEDTTVSRALSNEVTFRVNAVKVNVEEDIKDIKEPVTIPLDWKIILLYTLIGLLVIAAAVFAYLKLKKRIEEKGKPKVIVPPHVVALSELDELEKKHLWQSGLIKEFHSEITGIIRKYFEERFRLPALELTTGETLVLLNNTPDAKDVIDDAEVFLNNADMVKFAKFIPVNDVNEMMMKKAYVIIEKTIPAEKPLQEEEVNVQ
jgi:hypothetical protein